MGVDNALSRLTTERQDLGDAPGRANPGDKISTLVASALASGDCIDDADALRTGRTACALGRVVKAPSTLGIFLRSFRWGHVRQLDRVCCELLARLHHRPRFHHLRDLPTNLRCHAVTAGGIHQLVAPARAGYGHNSAMD